jgi:sugar phosphate isomerase/epimerase
MPAMPIILCDDCYPDLTAPICRRDGLGIEIQSFYDPAHPSRHPDTLAKHTTLLEGILLRSLHAPFGDLCPGSFDAGVRDLARLRFDTAYQVAETLHAGHIVLHDGYVPHTSSPSNYIKRSVEFWQSFLAGHPGEISCHLENLLEYDSKILSEIITQVGSPRLDACLDIGHAYCYSKISPLEWVKQLGAQIGYVHIHSNSGTDDQHLSLQLGSLPVAETLTALRQVAPQALWALEVSPECFPQSLDWLAEHGFM